MRRQSSLCVLLSFLFLLSLSQPRSSHAQQVICAFADSALADTIEAHIDAVSGQIHDFGQNLSAWPHEFNLNTDDDFKAFRQVFTLSLTDHVSARFSTPEWEDILHAIMNNDTTGTRDDVFGKVWDYFVRADADSNLAYAGIRFRFGVTNQKYTRIRILLYDTADNIGLTGSTVSGNRLIINASSNESVNFILGQGIAHELQHLCNWANGHPDGYEGINESLSTVAEYFLDSWRPTTFNLPYDSSIMDHEPCDIPKKDESVPQPKYQVYKAWMLYLYETFKGNSSDPTDDLLYRWIRNDASLSVRYRLDTLAEILWDENDYDWLGGVNATDRLNRLYANFLAAKFCNAPDFTVNGEFGIGPVNTVTDLGFFTDNDATSKTGKTPESPIDCPPYESSGNNAPWNVRILTPKYELGNTSENSLTTKANLYYDTDTSVDSIDVYMYGTDYVEFRAGAYFDDGDEHELRIEISGNGKATGSTKAIQPIGWVIGYSSSDDTLQVHPEHLVFAEPISFAPSWTSGGSVTARKVIVSDFGRSIKAVVLAMGASTLRPDLWTEPVNGLTYSYTYGVYTPTTSTRTWDGDVYVLGDVKVVSGGTLNIAAGATVSMFDSDLGETGDQDRIEFNVNGSLVADGSEANPIVFKPWSSSGVGNWLGFFVNSTSSGATFDHCTIKRSAAAIRSYAPLTVTHTEIDTCAWSGIVSKDGGVTISNCQLKAPGYVGIEVDRNANMVRNTLVKDALLYAVAAYDSASTALDIRGSEIAGSDTGLYVDGSVDVDIDSTCCFYQNDTAIHFYNSGTAATVKGAGITWSTSAAVLCDNSSSPRIDSNIFAHNGAGIYCTNSSSPVVESNEMQMTGYAIFGASSSYPDVGHSSPSSGQSAGNNKIGHTTKDVVNSNGSGTISARNNYWNTTTSPCTPSSGLFIGSVDYNSPVCPGSFPRWVGTEGEPEFEEWAMVYQMPGGAATDTQKRLMTELTNIVPNPFNPQTTIQYSLASHGRVEIKIYDVAGKLVQTLANETQVAGQHSVVWRGIDRRGSQVASGVYFVRMIAGSQVFTKKMVLLK
jgi:parallel beta-helix repeat protein